jgi:O-antigen ligase
MLTLALGFALAWLPLRTAVLVVGGAIYTTAILLRPTLGVYFLVIIIPFSSRLAVPVGEFRVGLMETVLALSVGAWVLRILASRTIPGTPETVKGGPFLWLFLVFIAAVSLSWLNALSIGASLVETIKWLEMLALYLLIVNLLPIGEVKWVVLTILLTGVAQAVLGLYQFVFKVGPAGFELFDGRFLRAYGTFDQPNPYAGYLGLVLPLALSLFIWALSQWFGSMPGRPNSSAQVHHVRLTPGSRIFAGSMVRLLKVTLIGLSLLVLVAALIASQSRGAWVGFAAAAVVVLVVRSKKSAAVFAGLALVLALYGLVSSFDAGSAFADGANRDSALAAVTGRFANAVSILSISDVATTPVTDANFATVERLAHWQAAREMWRDNPWFGVGFGNYAAIYPAYAVGRWLDPLGHAHNYLLNLGAEVGLVGIASYFVFWFFGFGLLWYTLRRCSGFYQAIAIGGLAVMVHLQVHNLVDNLYVQGMYLHVAIILGLVSVIYSDRQT